MSTTTDPNDPRLGYGSDSEPGPQNEAYLVLSAEERAQGFVRPLRYSYIHTGIRPTYPTRELTAEEKELYGEYYVCFEPYPESESPKTGRFWTQKELTSGCGAQTTMARDIAETYARNPAFYGSTYCIRCRMHLPVREFAWVDDGSTVGN